MNYSTHPFFHVFEVSIDWGEVDFEFSVYEYKPQSILDNRTTITVNSNYFDSDWLDSTLASLEGNDELAFNSRIRRGGRYRHLPLIDLNCSVEELDLAKRALRKVLPNRDFVNLVFYDSGRSIHAYGVHLLGQNEWIRFMGRLLLANFPGEIDAVDTRWIGHRLLGGYSSLRWSSNSSHYIKRPELIKETF